MFFPLSFCLLLSISDTLICTIDPFKGHKLSELKNNTLFTLMRDNKSKAMSYSSLEKQQYE